MTELSMKLEGFDLAGRLMDGTARQLPFATARAINATTKDFKRAVTARMGKVFTVRRRQFIERAVKIKQFARKTNLEAEARIEPPGGTADILAKFEPGGQKRARDGRSIAVPILVRKNRTAIIRRRDRPKAFAFRQVGRSFRGKRRTFLIPHVGIYQRIGAKGTKRRRGAGRRLAADVRSRKVRDLNIKTLYSLKPSVPIRKMLRFVGTAQKVVPRVWPGHFTTEFARAVRTARR